MSIQSSAIRAELDQNRVRVENVVPVQPKSITGIIRLITMILGVFALSTLSVVMVARTGVTPTIIEPPQHLLPGNVQPNNIHCGASADETCYPPVDAHCYESSDANCFISASIQQNGKVVHLTLDTATRMIAFTVIPAHEYTIGDLILAWGTPSGFTQYGRNIDVYWGTRNAHLTTCAFRPESRVELIIYYLTSPLPASPWHVWHSFSRIKSKDCW
jgi:hypothetical protein